MIDLILIISLLVLIYTKSYLEGDPHIIRFYSYLGLFILAMFLVISAENLLIVFIGWEGVGIISYLLINYWYISIFNNTSALKALFLNKIGDWTYLLGLIFIFAMLNDFSLISLFSIIHYIN